jgi:hypothetical protein
MQTPAFEAHPNAVVTAATLRRALVVAAQRVIAAREELNRINVFPVPDGDTGSNLAATLGNVLHTALGQRSRHAGELLARVGNAAIDGARGNSGAIMAQFLMGAAEQARSLPQLDAAALAAAVRRGAESARAALAQPVEGTILSVMTAFSDALNDSVRQPGGNARAAFTNALQRAQRALQDTPKQMAVLQKAGVVDAGALGFVDWLEGVADYLGGDGRLARQIRAAGPADAPAESLPHLHQDVDPQRRYCTECLVLGSDINRVALRDALLADGIDSLVVAGNASRVRVHGHAGKPQQLFDICAQHGQVEAMKADDMLMQQRSVESAHLVAVITDSAADLPAPLAEQLGIHVVPVRVSLEGRDYLDRAGLSAAEFYRRMAACAQLPQTSQPPPGDFKRVFEHVLGYQPAGVYVGLSRPLSGTLQSGETAARMQARPLHCVDTANVSVGQALLVWRAGELAQASASVDAIQAELERLRPFTRTFAMARDISHAVRGGRLPRWAAPLVRFSGLTPVAAVTPQGLLKVAGGLFARKHAAQAFARHVAASVGGAAAAAPAGWRVIVGHADAPEEGRQLLAGLRERLPIAEAYLVEVGPAIGAHTGPGALLVGLQPAPCV